MGSPGGMGSLGGRDAQKGSGATVSLQLKSQYLHHKFSVQLDLTRGHSPGRRLFALQGRNCTATSSPEPPRSIWFNGLAPYLFSYIFNLTPPCI
jgi:hypothetical protein